MMTSHFNHLHQTSQSVIIGTADPDQQQDGEDAMKNGIRSDLTSSVSSFGDVTASFTGASVSETTPSCSSVSTSVGVQIGTVNGSVMAESNPQLPSVAKSNMSNSTEQNGNLTRTLLKAMANVKRDNKTSNKAPHFHSNYTAAGLPRAYNQTRKFSSVTNPKSPAFPPSRYMTNGTVSSVNDRFLSTDKLRSRESEMSVDLNRGPQNHNNNFPPESSARDESCVNVRFLSTNKLRSGESEMSLDLNRGRQNHYNNFPPESSARDESCVNVRFLSTNKLRSGESEVSVDLNRGRQNHYNNFPPESSARDESRVNVRFLSTNKLRSGESEMAMQLTRGPRGHYENFPLLSSGTSATKDDFPLSVCRDKYNLLDFQTEYETAQFYIIKSFNEDDIHKSIKYDVWTSTVNGNRKLNAAFNDAEAKLLQTGTKCPIFLFFSVNASMQFVGVAEMLGPVDYKKDMKFWKIGKYNGFFPIKWHIIKDVPNKQLRHIILESNENRPVTFTRDTQEIGLKQGLEMLNIFKTYPAETSLLDDFDFYEYREKVLGSQRKHTDRRGFQHRVTIAAEEEIQSTVDLLNLTNNLSLS